MGEATASASQELTEADADDRSVSIISKIACLHQESSLERTARAQSGGQKL